MKNDLLETIRQRYNGIDIDRLKMRRRAAAYEAASRLGVVELWGGIAMENGARVENTPEYKKAIAHIYTQISRVEKYVADDLQAIINDEAAKETPEGQKLGWSLRWLQDRCKDYHDLVEGTEYDLQPMQAAALPDSLKSDKAKRAFEIAKERGYIREGGNPYKWNLSPVLLAYFIGRLLGDEVKHGIKGGKSEWVQKSVLPAKEIEAYFDCRNVGQLRANKKQQSGYVPREAAKIDDILNELE